MSDAPKRKTHGLRAQDAWRKHPLINFKLLDNPLPGLRNAVIIFSCFVVVDQTLRLNEHNAKQRMAYHRQFAMGEDAAAANHH